VADTDAAGWTSVVAAPRAFAGSPDSVGATSNDRSRRRVPVALRLLLAPIAPSTWAAQIHLVLDVLVGRVLERLGPVSEGRRP